ncbi:MAG TPA: inositol monophosphatase family protein [Solirubrobacteraceae bacterium]|nr:inositol monophosphatase family protein [Solirubrobacteraceae bacterium]
MTDADEDELLAVALEAARGAGAELRSRFGRAQHGVRTKSGPTDLVSDADLAAEAAIRDVLRTRRPEDGILAEEGGATAGGALRWVVDPLDGTTNFLFGVPMWGVSVACEDAEGGLVGVVLDPMRDECFAATRSGAPTLNGEPISARHEGDLADALVATGFSYDAAVRARQAEVITRLLPRVRDVRRMGAAALDLCWTACGRFDAHYERGLKAWDVAAGSLIGTRAGLEVVELPETVDEPSGVVMTRAGLMEEMLALVLGPAKQD